MEKPIVKAILLTNNQILISQIDEVAASVPGEPDCKLTNPFVLVEGGMLESWMMDVTREDIFMISSDKIMTLTDPSPTLLEKYQEISK
tara:strand:+ start:823 stop:1086 length:264 start_codon:yes stop_codon:yes gene_type:complete